MLKIVKSNHIVTKQNIKLWKELPLDDKDILRDKLKSEQSLMCAYCESKLNRFHIDHFYKRDLYPNKIFDYDNLFMSCNNENRCAKYKDKSKLVQNDYNTFYSPLDINLDEVEYTFTGDIISSTSKGINTINRFNLNDKSLIEKRKKIIKECVSLQNIDFDLFEIFCEFKNLFKLIEDNKLCVE